MAARRARRARRAAPPPGVAQRPPLFAPHPSHHTLSVPLFRTPPARLVCVSASNVWVLPHTNNANPHKSRGNAVPTPCAAPHTHLSQRRWHGACGLRTASLRFTRRAHSRRLTLAPVEPRPPHPRRLAPPRTPPFRLLCGFASNVCVLPHTNNANPHKSRGNAAPTSRAPRHTPHAATMTRRQRPSPRVLSHAPPLAPRPFASCVSPRQMCAFCHIQITQTHTKPWRVGAERSDGRRATATPPTAHGGRRATDGAERGYSTRKLQSGCCGGRTGSSTT